MLLDVLEILIRQFIGAAFDKFDKILGDRGPIQGRGPDRFVHHLPSLPA